ncbi:MAG: polysaccharide biosynthesis protein, partial [Anaerolineae bacterium]
MRGANYRPEPDSRLFVWLTNLHNRHFLFLDVFVILLSAGLSILFSQGWLKPLGEWMISFASLSLISKLVSLYLAGVYHRFWRYASGYEFVRLTIAVIAGSLLLTLAAYLLAIAGYLPAPPFSLLVMDFLMTAAGVAGTRYGLRMVESWLRFRNLSPSQRSFQRVLLVGASPMGAMMVTEMQENPQLGLIPVGFVDDELAGRGVRIRDVPVLGSVDQLEQFVRGYKIHQVFITWPNAPGKLVRQVMEVAQRCGAKVGIAPDITQVLEGQITCNRIREVQLEDLLRRDPVPIDMSRVEAILRGRRIMVTGAGGSIGSELCRQAARCGPAEIVLLGHGENSLFSVSNELRQLFPDLTMHVVVADIRDAERMEQVFERYRPACVFHAAAHKHVPLMETNPEEAVTNNVWGTWNLLNLSGRYGVERFVLISTDKAVMPSSMMGATKRVAELLLREKARELGRPYVAVRFGNVLGSRGSVVPLFREQIA